MEGAVQQQRLVAVKGLHRVCIERFALAQAPLWPVRPVSSARERPVEVGPAGCERRVLIVTLSARCAVPLDGVACLARFALVLLTLPSRVLRRRAAAPSICAPLQLPLLIAVAAVALVAVEAICCWLPGSLGSAAGSPRSIK